jgi:hypothetical protein
LFPRQLRLLGPVRRSGLAPLSAGGGGASPAWKFCKNYPDLDHDPNWTDIFH